MTRTTKAALETENARLRAALEKILQVAEGTHGGNMDAHWRVGAIQALCAMALDTSNLGKRAGKPDQVTRENTVRAATVALANLVREEPSELWANRVQDLLTGLFRETDETAVEHVLDSLTARCRRRRENGSWRE